LKTCNISETGYGRLCEVMFSFWSVCVRVCVSICLVGFVSRYRKPVYRDIAIS